MAKLNSVKSLIGLPDEDRHINNTKLYWEMLRGEKKCQIWQLRPNPKSGRSFKKSLLESYLMQTFYFVHICPLPSPASIEQKGNGERSLVPPLGFSSYCVCFCMKSSPCQDIWTTETRPSRLLTTSGRSKRSVSHKYSLGQGLSEMSE